MNLTEHFTLEEMTFSQTAARLGIHNTPSPEIIKNLTRLCEFLEIVRKTIGRPLIISSGYRSPELNKQIGGSVSSQHSQGCAADFKIKGMTPDDVVKVLIKNCLPYDQLIREFDSWTHISVPTKPDGIPRRQALIIDNTGTRIYA